MATPAFGLRIKFQGLKPKDLAKVMSQRENEIKKELKKIAKITGNQIRTTILNRKKRKGQYNSKGLANAFKPTKIYFKGNEIYIGIGDLPTLNKKYPYWAMINYGGMVKRGFLGWFGHKMRPNPMLRGSPNATEVFHENDGGYLMKPTVPIKPMNYIEDTISWLNTYWYTHWEHFFSKKSI